jgi:hypothetical protein
MKNLFYFGIIAMSLIVIASCSENGTNGDDNSFRKLKITIYLSQSGDTNDYFKNSEYFFDGDVNGFPRRTFLQNNGNSNYKSILVQERSNVPLPLFKFGCLTKNIEYSKDSSYYAITHFEFDSDGYYTKGSFDSYSPSNESLYVIYTRAGELLQKTSMYEENILDRISNFYYNSNGLCTLQVDSSVISNSVNRTFRRYNEKKECIYVLRGNDTSSGSVTEYFYDNDGNNIRTLSYTKNNNDTSNTRVSNWIIYKGYRIEEKKIDRFEFDSNDNIIGYINPDFGKSRYKIEYTYY